VGEVGCSRRVNTSSLPVSNDVMKALKRYTILKLNRKKISRVEQSMSVIEYDVCVWSCFGAVLYRVNKLGDDKH
jgi:hypothetical protein